MVDTTGMGQIMLDETAPDFRAETTEGNISFHEWIGDSWCLLFSHPGAFTPVCTTEMGHVAKIKSEFDKRGVKVIGLSLEEAKENEEWYKEIQELQNVKMNFPIICDFTGDISRLYGMIHPKIYENKTVRSVFLIDPEKKVRFMITYPPTLGRNFDEILRAIDSIQLSDKYRVLTPANWKEGDECIIETSIKDKEELEELFPKGYKEIRPYYRTTPDPR